MRSSKSIVLLLILFVATLAVFLAGIFVQAQTVSPTANGGERAMRKVQIRGSVAAVLRTKCRGAAQNTNRFDARLRSCPSMDLIVFTKNKPQRISIGPIPFLRRNHFLFVPGEQLIILGFQNAGSSEVLAEEIVMNKRALTLRSDDGTPVWRGTPLSLRTSSVKSKVLTVTKENQDER
jgi:hypothetical protein